MNLMRESRTNKELEIINFFGESNQAKKLNEEAYELCEAILLDDGSMEALEHIREEYIDCCLLLKQIFEAYELYRDEEANREMYSYKLNRTLEIIKKKKGERNGD